ncbi:glycosyl hydrolase catalytic core-domain-containing protein [Mycena alexandri]|uniref:Glycosyl hydrolase catalytic core-domain-containing protein n=1 Tax=Mycena alexandri TaxID=1745969 RepID=A0AAD6X342_9AGAR|nr:glycosyl hydrolase catalytic core-domain-containing protein [Mycena alexandri]
MISWKALAVFALLAGQSAAASHNARHAHAKHAAARNTNQKRTALGRRASCKAPSSSLSSAAASSTHTTTSTTTQQTTTKKTTTAAAQTTTKASTSSGGSSKSSGSSSSSGSVKSVQAAAGFTPNNIKAGTSSGNAYSSLQNHIGWWYDWTPNPAQKGSAVPVPMLWGGGSADGADSSRLAAFEKITTAPQYMLGFEEPDCPSGGGSAGMSVSEGVSVWEAHIAPFKAKGTKLGSPSMCKQVAETWLKQFSEQISTDWDFTNIHVNKNNMDGVRADLDHYASYGKPIWVSEFACVDDSTGFEPCTDQGEINTFINDIVDLFQGDSRVAAYAYSNGEGLGSVWPMVDSNGNLQESGKTYIAAISKYH